MMGQNIMFSIIIPIYNVDLKLFGKCIASILAQSSKSYELILVNDGSSDECARRCDEYALEYDQISVIHKLNGGVSSARNAGIEKAQGKWMLFIDADDWIDKDALENISAIIGKSTAEVIFFGYYRNYIKKEVKLVCSKYVNGQIITGNDKVDLLKKTIAASIYGEAASKATIFRSACASAYKRDYLIENRILFPVYMAIGEDLLFRLYTTHYASTIQYSDYCYYHYRKEIIAANSVSVKYNEDTEERYLFELNQIQAFINKYKYDNLKDAHIFRMVEILTVLFRSHFFHRENPRNFWQKRKQAKTFMKLINAEHRITTMLYKQLPLKRKLQLFLMYNHMFTTYLLVFRMFEWIGNFK